MLLDLCSSCILWNILSVWDQLQKSDLPPPVEDMSKWEAEFHQMMNDQRNMDFDYDTVPRWENPGSPVAFDNDGMPLLGNYEFGVSLLPVRKCMDLRCRNREKQPVFG